MKITEVNVHQAERVASAVLGGVLLATSLNRHLLTGATMAVAGGGLLYRGISGHSFLYQALGVSTAQGNTNAALPEIERSITVEKPADELYRFWREPENLSQIMGDFGQVTNIDDNRSHWQVKAPLGRTIEWDSQIVEDRPGQQLSWRSLEGAQVYNEGRVTFQPAPADWGTVVTFHFRFDPPGGALGNLAVQRLNIAPRAVAEKALRRFKSLAETGEVPTLEHNPSARADAITK